MMVMRTYSQFSTGLKRYVTAYVTGTVADLYLAFLCYLTKCDFLVKNDPNSPVPRLSFAHRFDTKLREMSFLKAKLRESSFVYDEHFHGGRENILSSKNISAYHNQIAHG